MFFSSCGREFWIPLKLQWGSRGTYRVSKRQSNLLSSCLGELRIALELQQGNPASSWVEGGILCFCSNFGRKLCVFHELQR